MVIREKRGLCGFRLRKKCVILLICFVAISVSLAWGKETFYSNDFESENDIKPQVTGLPYMSIKQAEKKGIIETLFSGLNFFDKSHSGAKSYKLQVRLSGGKGEGTSRWAHWGTKFSPPLKLTEAKYLSGYMFVESLPKGVSAQIYAGVTYPDPSDEKGLYGVILVRNFTSVTNDWKFFHKNIYERAKRKCVKKGWNPEKLILNGWFLNLTGDYKGEVAAVYIDDIKVTDEPEEEFASGSGIVTFLGERKRYEVRKRKSYQIISGVKNLIENGSFEIGRKGWEVVLGGNGPDTMVWGIDEDGFHGEKCLKITHQSYNVSELHSYAAPIDSKRNYTLSFYAKSSKTGSMCLEGMPSIPITPGYNYGREVLHKITPTEKWQRYEVKLSQPNIPFYIFYNIKGTGTVRLDGFQLEEGDSTSYTSFPAVCLGIETNKQGNIFHSGEESLVLLSLYNGKKEDVTGKWNCYIKDFYGQVVKKDSFPINIKSEERLNKEITLKGLPNGIFWVRTEFLPADGEPVDAESSLAVIELLSNEEVGSESPFGLSQWNRYNRYKEAKLAEEIGMKHYLPYGPFIFTSFPENWKEENWQWAYADGAIKIGNHGNMDTTGFVNGIPAWLYKSAGLPPQGYVPNEINEKVLESFSEYIYEVVKRYSDRIKYWELWPEFVSNEKTAEIYAQLAKAAYESAKKADPECTFVGSGTCGARTGEFVKQAEWLFKAGALPYLDKIAVHPYCYPASPEDVKFGENLKKLRALIKQYNNGKEKGLWMTEEGWIGSNTFYVDWRYSENPGYDSFVSEEAQADYIVRMNLIALANGVERFYLFKLGGSAQPILPFAYPLTYGALLRPKASLPAYAAMARILRGKKFKSEIKKGLELRCYLFEGSEDIVAAIWSPDREAEVSLKTPFSREKIELLNFMGNVIPVKKVGKQFKLALSGSPLYLKVNKTNEKEFIEALSKAEIVVDRITAQIAFSPDISSLLIMVKNETNKDVPVDIKLLESPMAWKAVRKEVKGMSPKHKTSVFELPFTSVQFNFNNQEDIIKVKVSCGSKLFSFILRPFPCEYMKNTLTIDGNLDDWKGVTSFNLGEKDFCWRRGFSGKVDLSAKWYIGWDEQNFYFAADVEDDYFSQPFAGHEMWKGDSIQIAFDTLNDALTKDLYGADDYEYGFALTSSGPELYRWVGKEAGPKVMKKAKLKIVREGTYTIYEAAIPWKLLSPLKPEPGSTAGFNFTVMDSDGRDLKGYLQLTDGIAGYTGKRPGLFKDIVFIRK